MFLIDETIEKDFNDLIAKEVLRYQQAMVGIGTLEGLQSFIKSNNDSIEMLETVLGISGEKMKRITTMIRVRKGFIFDTEWNEKKLQKKLTENNALMDEFCDLFFNGKNSDLYKRQIPQYILDDFCIDNSTIDRITNNDTLTKLFKKKQETSYTAPYATAYQNRLKRDIEARIAPLGFSVEEGRVNGINEDSCYITDGTKYIVIQNSYLLTTGPGQTKIAKKISGIYRNIREREDIVLINMLDGAGWVARSTDYKKIYNDCHYFANLQNVDIVEQVVKDFLNI